MICTLASRPNQADASTGTELLVLVDSLDREIGVLGKDACHDGEGRLHRAFSAFIFNAQGELLLQQRSQAKRLWPGYWANSCCSHPRAGERMCDAVKRRIQQELGLQVSPEFVFKFEYQAHFAEFGSEHELCHVFIARTLDMPRVDDAEVQAWRWISTQALSAEIERHPNIFTPWLKLEWPQLLECLGV